MKVMIRKNASGVLSAYVPKKDLEEPIVSMERPEMWGGSVTLADLDLRVEEVEFNAVLIPELELVLVERDGLIGTCHLLPGDCFDPDDWEPASSAELGQPEAAGLIEEAGKRLRGKI